MTIVGGGSVRCQKSFLARWKRVPHCQLYLRCFVQWHFVNTFFTLFGGFSPPRLMEILSRTSSSRHHICELCDDELKLFRTIFLKIFGVGVLERVFFGAIVKSSSVDWTESQLLAISSSNPSIDLLIRHTRRSSSGGPWERRNENKYQQTVELFVYTFLSSSTSQPFCSAHENCCGLNENTRWQLCISLHANAIHGFLFCNFIKSRSLFFSMKFLRFTDNCRSVVIQELKCLNE